MSYGILCLRCRHYINMNFQHVKEHACECEVPQYSEDGKTEITKEEAERDARRFAGFRSNIQ